MSSFVTGMSLQKKKKNFLQPVTNTGAADGWSMAFISDEVLW